MNKIILIHPGLGNIIRPEVYRWCETTFGPPNCGESRRWWMTSNYTRNNYGTFDIYISNWPNALAFLLKWGGTTV